MTYAWLNATTPNAIILTPNSRLVRFLLRDYLAEQATNGQTHLATPQILPLARWLENCYRSWLITTTAPRTLLTPEQELFLWEKLIAHSEWVVFHPTKMAQLFAQAYQFLCAANLTLVDISAFGNIDVTTFIEVATMFEQTCAAQNLITIAQLPALLSSAFVDKQLSIPAEIILINFDDMPAQTTALFETLKMQGCRITTQEVTRKAKTIAQLATTDVTNEILTMACWAKTLHAQNPEQTITCIVPHLTQLRTQVEKVFLSVFFPATEMGQLNEQSIFNISGGYSLAQAPMINMALHILQLDPYVIHFETVSALLATPWIMGYATEYQARAQFDVQLRKLNEPELSWQWIIKQSETKTELAQWTEHSKAFLTLRNALPKKLLLADWVNHFLVLLTAMGWPGEQTLSSEEYQQVQRWYVLWHELANLDMQGTPISYSTAISILQQQTQKIIFQKETIDGPIQVLGLLEAAGQTSDHLWVMGLDSESWPQRARPNPFLPHELQRQHNMPHNSPERELHFSQQLMQRFAQSATHVIYSYHQQDGERELSPSPLLTEIPSINMTDLQLPAYRSSTEKLFAQHCVESINDVHAPSLASNINAVGGSAIFKDQSACPFRAFAHHRLKARELDVPEMGLSALERGSLLHGALDYTWEILKTHAQLCQQSDDELHEIVSDSIVQALQQELPHSRKLSPLFKKIEMARLIQLLLQWLSLEKKRPAFIVVERERSRRVQIGPLNINLKIDRMDELTDGKRLLIDYKSGEVKPARWFGERPEDPQLPLYAITENNLSGITFAQVRIDELGFKGISEINLGIDNIKLPDDYAKRNPVPDTWQALLSQWHETLTRLADEFYRGDAQVDPLTNTTCDYCDLHTLCRINEQRGHRS